MCVTNFTCILLENLVLSAACVSVSPKSVFKSYLSAVHFRCVLVVMGPFWQYEEFDDRYPKKPVSVTKKDISDFIYQSIYSNL